MMKKRCIYCGSHWSLEEEHIIARSKGGKSTIPSCRGCNRSKKDKPLMEWLRWLKQNDKYRWQRIRRYNKGKKNPIARKVQSIRDE